VLPEHALDGDDAIIHATASVESTTKVPDHLAARAPCPSADLGERTYQRRPSTPPLPPSQVSYRSRPRQGCATPPRRTRAIARRSLPLCLREGQRLQSNGCAGICVRRVFLTLGCHHSVWVAAAPWGNDLGSDSAALEHQAHTTKEQPKWLCQVSRSR
jgi:hypothetical protein